MPQPDPRLNLTGQGYRAHEQRSSVERSQRLDAQRSASSLDAPVQGVGEVATAALLRRFSSDATALSFYQQEMAPQFDAVPVDLVAQLAALERREDRVCKVAPSNPQQFRQPIDAAGQSFQLDHLRISFEMSKAAFLER